LGRNKENIVFMDKQQQSFKTYQVPDPIRILKVIKFIKRYFRKVDGLNILDCGVSSGGVTDILSKEGANCFGIDFNPRKIEGARIIQADLNEGIPELGIKFDIIFAGEVIEHLLDDGKFISDCFMVLKSEGILIVTVPNLVSFLNRFLMFFGSMPLTAYAAAPFHYHIYNRNKLKILIKEQGFKILKVTSSYLPLNLLTKIPIIGRIFSFLGDIFPTLGNQLMVFAKKC